MRYRVFKFKNGKYGVKDINDPVPVATGMTENEASKWCARLNLREAWGV